MSLESAITFFLAIVIFSITPGPGIFALIAKALSQGISACLALTLGMIFSDLVYLILACYGLAALAEHWGGAFTVIRILGASYLFYLGYKLWTAPIVIEKYTANKSKSLWLKNFMQGFLISASNPKVILFYIAFLPTFIDLTSLQRNDIALVTVLTFTGLLTGLMAITWAANAASDFFASPKAVKNLNRSAGSLMVGAAAFLALKG
jgi:threonine/homoserine/homoserine lactone efflux protein